MNIHWIIVHHSGGVDSNPLQDSSGYTVQECNADHKIRFNMLSSLGWYVGYTYFIDKEGVLTQTRIDTEEAAHCVGYNNHPGDDINDSAIGVCMAGNFDATLPTQAQIDTLRKLLIEKQAQYGIPANHIVPHRTFAVKTCYGLNLSPTWASELVTGTTPANHVFTVDMEVGDSSLEVTALQKRLQQLGYFPLNQTLTQYYGAITRAAVFAFQLDYIKNLSWIAKYIYRGRYCAQQTRAALNALPS